MSRRPLDKYDTPHATLLVAALVELLGSSLRGTVIEPCAGDGNMARAIEDLTGLDVIEKDILDPFPDHWDATDYLAWGNASGTQGGADWVITNPPFDKALPILENAFDFSEVGVAMLLPITWNEPCENRRDWLLNHADNLRYIMPVSPRPHFRKGEINPKTGKKYKEDPRTVCWYVWRKDWSWNRLGIPCPFQYLAGWR